MPPLSDTPACCTTPTVAASIWPAALLIRLASTSVELLLALRVPLFVTLPELAGGLINSEVPVPALAVMVPLLTSVLLPPP